METKILLNKEVISINWDDENESNKSIVTVECADDSCYSADHIIITVSVGVLKQNYKRWFKPELPPYKVTSIEHLKLGTVNKIFLKFPEKWWPNDIKGFSLIWTEEARDNLKNEISNQIPNGKSWLESVLGFYVIDYHPKVLLGWVVGELAAEVEKLPDQDVINNCMYLLKKYAGKKYNVMHPEKMLR